MHFEEQEDIDMKLKVLLKDGTSKTLDVVSFSVIDENRFITLGERHFRIDYKTIDKKLFEKKRKTLKQEETRMKIKKAFMMAEKHPYQYAVPFWTMVPKRKDCGGDIGEIIQYAVNLGGIPADWVHQALEWAQRITEKGEKAWKEICNEPDTHNSYRLIISEDGTPILMGGSRDDGDASPEAEFAGTYEPVMSPEAYDAVGYTVPNVVFYE